ITSPLPALTQLPLLSASALCVALCLVNSQLQGCLVAGCCLAALPAPLLVAAPGAAPYLLTHPSS
ncbi:hypothetical protein V8C86DRAFT_2778140, partial [Haematococcus lacustris]